MDTNYIKTYNDIRKCCKIHQVQSRNNEYRNSAVDLKFVKNLNVRNAFASARQWTAWKGVERRIQELVSQGISQEAAFKQCLSSGPAADS